MAAPQAYYYLASTHGIWLADDETVTPRSRVKISTVCPKLLARLPEEERKKALSFLFLRDAKLSLASSLLKRSFVCSALGVPWGGVKFARKGDPKHGKPAYVHASENRQSEVDFNVTHQAGIVALAGVKYLYGRLESKISVGIDVTCTSERRERDLKNIADEGGGSAGFGRFVDIHADVFSREDVESMKAPLGSPGQDLKQRLRVFYAYWALKEAFVKMEGEALLASWLKDVEFRRVRIPETGTGKGSWGETVEDIEVWLRGKRRENVHLFLQAFEDDYLIATAVVKGDGVPKIEAPIFELVDLETFHGPPFEDGMLE